MINTSQFDLNAQSASSCYSEREYSRILTAAVVNVHFRNLLLTNPEKAVMMGYGGEAFHLANDERRQVAAIRANSLADFARQLSQVQQRGYVSELGLAAD